MDILHGENIVASRQKLNEIINNFSGEIVRIDGKRMTLTQLKQAFESRSLFGKNKLVVIENLFSRPKSKEKEQILTLLKENTNEPIVIWEAKSIDGRKLIAFKKARLKKFSVTRYLFKFLESLCPGKQRQMLSLLQQSLINETPELIFYMMIRQIKMLIIAKDLGIKGLDKMAPWQKSRLTAQSKNFTMEKLLTLHHQLSEIDWGQKTGRSVFSLKADLEMLIIKI